MRQTLAPVLPQEAANRLTSVAMRDLPDLVHDTGTKVIGATARFTVHACWMLPNRFRFTVHACWMLPNRFRFIYASDSLRGCFRSVGFVLLYR